MWGGGEGGRTDVGRPSQDGGSQLKPALAPRSGSEQVSARRQEGVRRSQGRPMVNMKQSISPLEQHRRKTRVHLTADFAGRGGSAPRARRSLSREDEKLLAA